MKIGDFFFPWKAEERDRRTTDSFSPDGYNVFFKMQGSCGLQ